jgi:radical SAM superfamily enzyme YgiQ (UPF0313 family)
MVAISIMSISDESCRRVIAKIKVKSKTFVIVGPQLTTLTLKQLTDARRGKSDLLIAYRSIERIANITRNETHRCLVENLDLLPFPDRDLIYQNSGLGKMKLKSFMATRGCPYACSYCFNSAFKKLYLRQGKVLRRRSVDHLIEEIQWVMSNYPLKMIRFGDDNFVDGETAWFTEFVEKYKKKINLPFYCLIRPNGDSKVGKGFEKSWLCFGGHFNRDRK